LDKVNLEKIDTRGLPNNLFEMKHKYKESNNRNDDRFASVSSDSNYKDYMNYSGEDPGMAGTFLNLVGEAFTKSKEVIGIAKEKYEENDMNGKLKTVGETTLSALKYTGTTIHSIATSDTTKQIIGKTTENIGYLFNRLFYGNAPEEKRQQHIEEEEDNNDKFISSKSNSRYSPPRKTNTYSNEDELSGNVLFKKDSSKYSSKSYMN